MALEHLRLAVEWKRVTELADHDVHHQRFGGHATVDRALRRRCLYDGFFARTAGVAWAARHLNPQLARNNVELLGAVFTDLVQRATTAGALLALDIDDNFEARQVCRQGAAIAVGRLCPPPSPRWLWRVFGRLAFGGSLLFILQGKPQLIKVQLLRTRSVPMAQQTLDQQPKLFVLGLQLRHHLPQHSLQHVGIVR